MAAALGLSSLSHALYVVAFYLVSVMLFRDRVPTLGQHLLLVPSSSSPLRSHCPSGPWASARRLASNSSSWLTTRAVPWR